MMAVAIIMFLVAAYLFMTSQGDPQKIGRSKGALFSAIVGVILGLISLGIVEIFANFFEIDLSTCGI